MFATYNILSEEIDGIQFEIASLVKKDDEFYGTSFACINYPNSNGSISYDFIWDNEYWLLNEFYPLLKQAVDENVNLYELKPELFDDCDVEHEGEPEQLKNPKFYEDLVDMFEFAINKGMLK